MIKTYIIMIIIALGFNCLDVVVGFFNAWKDKTLSSKKMRIGLFHKGGFILTYCFCVLIDMANKQLQIGLPFTVLPIVIVYVIGTEIVSIWETLKKVNPVIDIKEIDRMKDEDIYAYLKRIGVLK